MSSEIIIPSNPKDREKIFKCIKDFSDSLTRIEAEKALISEGLKALGEEFEIKPKFLRRVLKAYHAQIFDEQVAEMGDFEDLYQAVVQ